MWSSKQNDKQIPQYISEVGVGHVGEIISINCNEFDTTHQVSELLIALITSLNISFSFAVVTAMELFCFGQLLVTTTKLLH